MITGAHFSGPGVPALLFDDGRQATGSAVRPGLKEGEPRRRVRWEEKKRVSKRAVYGEDVFRHPFKDYPTCTNNHGNLRLVINVLAGCLNHSGREMAQCLTV